MRALPAIIAIVVALAGCGGDDSAPAAGAPARFDAERAFGDLGDQVAIGSRPAGSPGARRAAALIADHLREAGAEGVTVQRPWRNVVGTIPGAGPGTVVVGAHYDTKDDVGAGFEGANDGASGVAVVLELARSLPRPLPGPSVALVLFDAEEARGERPYELDGARGSHQYVAYARAGGRQGAAPLDRIRAMVLFDMVGDCELRIPLEANSDPGLYALFADAAVERTGGRAPFEGRAGAIADDHVPFLDAGVPAVDLIDFEYGPGPAPGAYWHSPEDTEDKVCAESLAAVGEAALAAIPRIR
jgi:Zn-dependent M28 family amino/carboxypeptidase